MNSIESVKEAAEKITSASRIMVVGSSGAGKSTLSRKIARRFGLKNISMDKDFFWLPSWVARERVEQREMIMLAVRQDRWIMDGSNPSSFDLRMPRTDVVVWLRINRLTCLLSVMTRVLKSYGKVRPDMAPGCFEQLPDREFISYIWNFERRHAPILLRNFELYGPDVPVIQLKSRGDVRLLLDLLGIDD